MWVLLVEYNGNKPPLTRPVASGFCSRMSLYQTEKSQLRLDMGFVWLSQPMELVPIHPIHGVQDWDAAPGAISWQRLIDTLRVIKQTGKIPPDHRSHDHLNEQKEIAVDADLKLRWIEELKSIQQAIKERSGKTVIFGILDGFLLYWHPVSRVICLLFPLIDRSLQQVIEQLDIRIMLRVPHDVLKERRHQRHGYHTAGTDVLVVILLSGI